MKEEKWYSDLFLKEKLFPKLFLYGIGGFLSSNKLKKSNMGYSNYITIDYCQLIQSSARMRAICFFHLLVKELTDVKRSEHTYLRKAAKLPNLTAKIIRIYKKTVCFMEKQDHK